MEVKRYVEATHGIDRVPMLAVASLKRNRRKKKKIFMYKKPKPKKLTAVTVPIEYRIVCLSCKYRLIVR